MCSSELHNCTDKVVLTFYNYNNTYLICTTTVMKKNLTDIHVYTSTPCSKNMWFVYVEHNALFSSAALAPGFLT